MPAFLHLRVPVRSGFVLAVSLLFVGCAPRPVVVHELVPLAEVTWRGGQATSHCRDTGLAVEAGFLREESGLAFLQVRVRNTSTESIELDPARFAATAHLRDTTGRGFDRILLLLDRETKRREVDDAIARVNAETNPYRVSGFETTVDAVGGLIGLATLFAKKTPEQRLQEEKADEERAQRRRDRERQESEWSAQHDRTLYSLREQRRFWTEEALGRTSLSPEASAEGVVVALLHPDAETVDLVVRAGAGSCTIPFRQLSRKL